jgi:hypothetical protein
MKMKSESLGTTTSQVEITHISQHGIWLLCNEKEFFLPYGKFPWFKQAKVSEIHNVKMLSPEHLYWENLDVDLSLTIIEKPESFTLVARS